MTEHGAKYADGSEIPVEIIHEILLQLPTRDVVRCSGVSTQWRSAVRDPSFRTLHAANHLAAVAAAPAELLLVWEHRRSKRHCVEATVFNASLGKPMCQVTNPPGYSLTNICGGFLCFAPTAWDREEPAIVCNPVTGEKVKLPNPKKLMIGWTDFLTLGFSPSTQELKMFRYTGTMTSGKKYLDVYTLGDSSTGGWRRRPYLAQHCPMYGGHLPVLVGGKLWVVIGRKDGYDRKPDGVLVIDVASETHFTYRLPRLQTTNAHVHAFDLHGRLCLAVGSGEWCNHPKLHFWVMPPLDRLVAKDGDDIGINWDLRYTFDVKDDFKTVFQFERWRDAHRGAWLDDDEMMCHRLGDTLYKYDTGGHSLVPNSSETLQWTQKLQLPPIPHSRLLRSSMGGLRWLPCHSALASHLSIASIHTR